jgi:hypothetical protein
MKVIDTYIYEYIGTYYVEACGAQGGINYRTRYNAQSGLGGCVTAIVDVIQPANWTITVGGQGGSGTKRGATGGYNGGGNAMNYSAHDVRDFANPLSMEIFCGGGGGGATVIHSDSIAPFIVAGGGGGAGLYQFDVIYIYINTLIHLYYIVGDADPILYRQSHGHGGLGGGLIGGKPVNGMRTEHAFIGLGN